MCYLPSHNLHPIYAVIVRIHNAWVMSVTGGRGKWALHYEEIADLVIALEGYGPLTLPPPLPFPLPSPSPSLSPHPLSQSRWCAACSDAVHTHVLKCHMILVQMIHYIHNLILHYICWSDIELWVWVSMCSNVVEMLHNKLKNKKLKWLKNIIVLCLSHGCGTIFMRYKIVDGTLNFSY